MPAARQDGLPEASDVAAGRGDDAEARDDDPRHATCFLASSLAISSQSSPIVLTSLILLLAL